MFSKTYWLALPILGISLIGCGSDAQTTNYRSGGASNSGDGTTADGSQNGQGNGDATATDENGNPVEQVHEHCLHSCDADQADDTEDPSNAVTRGLLVQDVNNASVWIYKIPSGQGASAWNSADTTFELKKGEIWRIVNEDASVDHQLHTNGIPCPHGGNRRVTAGGGTFGSTSPIPVGGYIECDISINTALDLTAGGGGTMYDHLVGQGTGIIHAKFDLN